MDGDAGPITVLLAEWRAGDASALDRMLPRIYEELHRLANGLMRRERRGHTLSATDLIDEAYLRLAGTPLDARDRVHFLAIASRVMRQILVDHARRRAAAKRGHGEAPVPLDEELVAAPVSDDLVELDLTLQQLATFDERKARAIELRYFGGLTQDEIAQVLGVHVNTVARELRLAEAWMHAQLRPGS